ncbi:NUDIX hydrolase [Modicisalibacter coralii]|uniref:NUDIX hydrolase n=1 Tax=Modicisalibacter coralii TaxID=2304602 RepID=UPI00100AAC5E|nr:NUDIX domain-containing protein [Halomonas coralii]
MPQAAPSIDLANVKAERVQLVDARNRPCGSAPRRTMRRLSCWHRATYVFVRDSRGALCVQQRTPTKEVYPGYHDLAAGGVVGAGEAVHVSARRELAEELGVEGARLRWCLDFVFRDAANRVHGSVFLTDYDGPLRLQAEEVAGAEWLAPDAALALETSTPDSRRALELLRQRGFL